MTERGGGHLAQVVAAPHGELHAGGLRRQQLVVQAPQGQQGLRVGPREVGAVKPAAERRRRKDRPHRVFSRRPVEAVVVFDIAEPVQPVP